MVIKYIVLGRLWTRYTAETSLELQLLIVAVGSNLCFASKELTLSG